MTPLARRRFGDSIARDERGRFWYIQGPQPGFNFESSCDRELDPCRLVRASASPFSATARKLLPALNIDGAGEQQIKPFAADPPVLTGELSRAILRRGNLVGREPVPGIGLDLLRTRSIDKPGPFTATGLTTTTDQAGRWAFRLNQPSPDVLLVVAPGLRIVPVDSSTRRLVDEDRAERERADAGGDGRAGAAGPARAVDRGVLLAGRRRRRPRVQALACDVQDSPRARPRAREPGRARAPRSPPPPRARARTASRVSCSSEPGPTSGASGKPVIPGDDNQANGRSLY